MRFDLRPTALSGALIAILLAIGAGPVAAQELKQMALTDQQVTSFIAAQTDFAPLVVKLSEAGEAPDDALKGELDGVSKKHGFQSFDEYMDVNDNIAFVLGGLNSKTMAFTEPVERLKADLEEIKADNEIPDDEKKLAIEDLNQEIAATQPLKFKENIEVVKRHFAELVKLLPDEGSLEGEDAGADEGEDGKGDDKGGPAP